VSHFRIAMLNVVMLCITIHYAECRNAERRIFLLLCLMSLCLVSLFTMLIAVMLIVAFSYCNSDRRYVMYHYAECRYAECCIFVLLC
jgi:hypothetical protein